MCAVLPFSMLQLDWRRGRLSYLSLVGICRRLDQLELFHVCGFGKAWPTTKQTPYREIQDTIRGTVRLQPDPQNSSQADSKKIFPLPQNSRDGCLMVSCAMLITVSPCSRWFPGWLRQGDWLRVQLTFITFHLLRNTKSKRTILDKNSRGNM